VRKMANLTKKEYEEIMVNLILLNEDVILGSGSTEEEDDDSVTLPFDPF
jgi:hypothetical protein